MGLVRDRYRSYNVCVNLHLKSQGAKFSRKRDTDILETKISLLRRICQDPHCNNANKHGSKSEFVRRRHGGKKLTVVCLGMRFELCPLGKKRRRRKNSPESQGLSDRSCPPSSPEDPRANCEKLKTRSDRAEVKRARESVD